MPSTRSHALVIGFRKEDDNRHRKIPAATIDAGPCIGGCRRHVYVNTFGASAIRDRDADVCCLECEATFHADINRSLIES